MISEHLGPMTGSFTAATDLAVADPVSTLWVIVATVLALLMAPGVAFFYGGLVRVHSVINMMMMSFGAMAIVTVLWVTIGYGMVFGHASIPHLVGDPLSHWALGGIEDVTTGRGAHQLAMAGFHAAFAIDVVALVSGAIADRARFGAWMLFAALWVTLVYFPVARWIFDTADGWAARAGVNDFAGGAAVHVNAGAAALALALVLGKRAGFRKGIDRPHNVPLTLLGAAMLWIGWFGFNAGSEGALDGIAVLASVNTLVAPAGAVLGWLAIEKVRDGKPSSIGAVSGLVAGLVAAAPSCNVLTPGWMLVLGALVGVVCALVADLRYSLGLDDSLNVVGLHLVGGVLGMLFVGLVGRGMGVVETGSWHQMGVQVGVTVAVLAYSFAMAWGIATAIQRTMGFRVAHQHERSGLDSVLHGEEGYAIVAGSASPDPA